MTAAGYSGTPLAKKLGIVEGTVVVTRHEPPDYAALVAPLPPHVRVETTVSTATNLVHVFCDRKAVLQAELQALRGAVPPAACIWVSWPKRASKVPTDITEDTVRDVALPLGFVDVKVCAVSDVWSGLKLVIRKALR